MRSKLNAFRLKFHRLIDCDTLIGWSSTFNDNTRRTISKGHIQPQNPDNIALKHRLGWLEADLSFLFESVCDSDTKWQSPVTIEVGRLLYNVGRAKRIVEEADQLMQEGKYLVYHTERCLLPQLIWDSHSNPHASVPVILEFD